MKVILASALAASIGVSGCATQRDSAQARGQEASVAAAAEDRRIPTAAAIGIGAVVAFLVIGLLIASETPATGSQ